MQRALTSKKKIRFINGGMPPLPETDPTYEARETCNTVVSWINRSLSPKRHPENSSSTCKNASQKVTIFGCLICFKNYILWNKVNRPFLPISPIWRSYGMS